MLVGVVSALVIFRKINRSPFCGDESGWIAAGYYYTDLLGKGDFEWKKWVRGACGGFGRMNLQLCKVLIGIPLQLDPVTRAEPDLEYERKYTSEGNYRQLMAIYDKAIPQDRADFSTTPLNVHSRREELDKSLSKVSPFN
ncbi:MAG: hypothetical protein WB676_33860 [Bryobacteraceae bacterium]